MQSGKDDDDLVSCIGGLADEAGVVAGLPGLNVSNDKAPAVPWPIASRIFEKAQHRIGGPVEGFDSLVRKASFQPFTVSLPIAPVLLSCGIKPWDVVFVALQRSVLADPETETPDE